MVTHASVNPTSSNETLATLLAMHNSGDSRGAVQETFSAEGWLRPRRLADLAVDHGRGQPCFVV
jgi:hypothetical protein